MFIPNQPGFEQSATYGAYPVMFSGTDAPDGDAGYFVLAPEGSIYIQRTAAGATMWVKTLAASTDAAWVVAGSPNTGTGKIDIPLATLREHATSAILNAAGNGGLLCSDTTPILNTINADTDSAYRLLWAASNSDPIGFQLSMPNDRNTAAPMTLKVHAAMAAAADTPTIAVETFFDVGDTKVADTIAAITGATYATYSATIAAADIPAAAITMSCELTPGAHTTDTLAIVAIWLEYTRA